MEDEDPLVRGEIKAPSFFGYKTSNKTSILSFVLMLLISCILSYVLFIQIRIHKQQSSTHFDYSEYDKIAIISDIHLEPDQNATFCRGMKRNKTHYDSIYGVEGCDPPFQFVDFSIKSFGDHIKQLGNVKLVFDLGDATGHGILGMEQSLNTTINITGSLLTMGLDIPIYSTIGNNDFPGDYKEPENKTYFYSIIWKQYSKMLNKSSKDLSNTTETFVSGGYYTVEHSPNLWIISLNTVSFSISSNVSENTGIVQLEWLSNTLSEAQGKSVSVVLIGHIPPERALYQLGKVQNTRSMMWKDLYIAEFNKIISFHSGIIRFSLFAHQHCDSWFVKKHANNGFISHFIVPSISEIFENHPSYTFGIINEKFELLDLQHYQCPLDYFTRINQTPKYLFQYSFKETYLPNAARYRDDPITADLLYNLTEKIISLKDMLYVFKQRLMQSYQLNWLPEISPYQMYCGMTCNTVNGLEDCLKSFKYYDYFKKEL